MSKQASMRCNGIVIIQHFVVAAQSRMSVGMLAAASASRSPQTCTTTPVLLEMKVIPPSPPLYQLESEGM